MFYPKSIKLLALMLALLLQPALAMAEPNTGPLSGLLPDKKCKAQLCIMITMAVITGLTSIIRKLRSCWNRKIRLYSSALF